MESHVLNLSCSTPPMVEIAILNAKYHGINLHHGVPNLANGDCAIEAVTDNISTRPEFNKTFCGASDVNRRNWMQEAEELVFNFSGGAGMTEEEFRAQWDILKKSGTYEYDLGDFVLAAIAHCTKKDILIFNTRPDGPFDPIFVVSAAKLANRKANTKIPVLLAYNQVHFEGLVPDSHLDMEKTIELKEKYLRNEYFVKKKIDIPMFACHKDSYAEASKKSIPSPLPKTPLNKITQKSQPQTQQLTDLIQGTNSILQTTQNTIPKIRIKDMTPEEKRNYKRLKEQERRKRMDNAQKEEMKENDRRRKANQKETARDRDLLQGTNNILQTTQNTIPKMRIKDMTPEEKRNYK